MGGFVRHGVDCDCCPEITEKDYRPGGWLYFDIEDALKTNRLQRAYDAAERAAIVKWNEKCAHYSYGRCYNKKYRCRHFCDNCDGCSKCGFC